MRSLDCSSQEPIPDALLPSVVEFIRSFPVPVYRVAVVRCTRKTGTTLHTSQVALWQYLFAAVSCSRDLFLERLWRVELTTAASCLILLQV